MKLSLSCLIRSENLDYSFLVEISHIKSFDFDIISSRLAVNDHNSLTVQKLIGKKVILKFSSEDDIRTNIDFRMEIIHIIIKPTATDALKIKGLSRLEEQIGKKEDGLSHEGLGLTNVKLSRDYLMT
ncbi:hypothetical protein RCL_jg23053.t1 [Rhizophagus clarus]|uniref:Uncharacterized protein n=1 Tax=Rhizophagus clarus TaxID=94130 RepID=A0A8H3L6L1_9GLOM|nr:hypothetical protein RCL_jg23053.t1 [Rhizophagus clarus]